MGPLFCSAPKEEEEEEGPAHVFFLKKIKKKIKIIKIKI
jgi:hypothetical protein